jgi:hypothetical protein
MHRQLRGARRHCDSFDDNTMKRTTYTITMSDGQSMKIGASSAADAIQLALEKFRGRTVVHCYAGVTEGDKAQLLRMDRHAKPVVGTVEIDIPVHKAIEPDALLPTRARKKDATENLFGAEDDEAILIESENAMRKAGL